MSDLLPCPCCGEATIGGYGGFEMCDVCDWEDDGQNDSDADEVFGGPNSDYSLTEARNNYKRYGCMYRPGDEKYKEYQGKKLP